MGASDDDTVEEGEEKKPYGLWWRVALFIFIAGPASVFAFGIYGRIAVRTALSASTERSDYFPMVVLGLWVFGLVSTALMIFKR